MTEQTPWESLDDASVGKAAKEIMGLLAKGAELMDRQLTTASVLMLCCVTSTAGKDKMTVEVDGITEDGREFGDWTVTVVKRG